MAGYSQISISKFTNRKFTNRKLVDIKIHWQSRLESGGKSSRLCRRPAGVADHWSVAPKGKNNGDPQKVPGSLKMSAWLKKGVIFF